MADVTAAQVRMMLQGYEQQLLAARRLARLRMRRRVVAGDDPNDPDPSVPVSYTHLTLPTIYSV